MECVLLEQLLDPAKPYKRVYCCTEGGKTCHIKVWSKSVDTGRLGEMMFKITASFCDASGAALRDGDAPLVLHDDHSHELVIQSEGTGEWLTDREGALRKEYDKAALVMAERGATAWFNLQARLALGLPN